MHTHTCTHTCTLSINSDLPPPPPSLPVSGSTIYRRLLSVHQRNGDVEGKFNAKIICGAGARTHTVAQGTLKNSFAQPPFQARLLISRLGLISAPLRKGTGLICTGSSEMTYDFLGASQADPESLLYYRSSATSGASPLPVRHGTGETWHRAGKQSLYVIAAELLVRHCIVESRSLWNPCPRPRPRFRRGLYSVLTL